MKYVRPFISNIKTPSTAFGRPWNYTPRAVLRLRVTGAREFKGLDYVIIQQDHIGLSSDLFERISKDLKCGVAVNRGCSWRKDRMSLEVSTEEFCDLVSILSQWSAED
jgi:hypothetical protein